MSTTYYEAVSSLTAWTEEQWPRSSPILWTTIADYLEGSVQFVHSSFPQLVSDERIKAVDAVITERLFTDLGSHYFSLLYKGLLPSFIRVCDENGNLQKEKAMHEAFLERIRQEKLQEERMKERIKEEMLKMRIMEEIEKEERQKKEIALDEGMGEAEILADAVRPQ